MPRTQVIDGLEGAFDVDRMGLAPDGAALEVGEARPTLHASLQPRLLLANVRWVLSFDPVPDDRLALRREVAIPEVREPLRLYEVRRPLPRAFFVPSHEVEPPAEAAAAGRIGRTSTRGGPYCSTASPVTAAAGRRSRGHAGLGRRATDLGPGGRLRAGEPAHGPRHRRTPRLPGGPRRLPLRLVGGGRRRDAASRPPGERPVSCHPDRRGAHVFTLLYRPRWRAAALAAMARAGGGHPAPHGRRCVQNSPLPGHGACYSPRRTR